MVTVRMQADLKVQIGTRLFYDCPSMSMEDHKSDLFFKKYRGRTATVVGFSTKLVPPLNLNGDKPGVYYTGGLKVQFDGDETVHDDWRSLGHFVVIGPAEIIPAEIDNFVSDLPEDPAFYPFDVVAKQGDLLAEPRLVVSVDYNRDGKLVCDLADTEDMKQARQRKEQTKRDQAKAEGLWSPTFSFHSNESVDASELRLVERGNVYWLYHDYTKLDFDSSEEEIGFWALDGISKVVHVNERWRFPLKRAREIVASGVGDIIIKSITANRGDDTCEVLRLHDLFDQYRGRIRALADGAVVPEVRQTRDPFKALVGMMTVR
jgi:hypothetical protein